MLPRTLLAAYVAFLLVVLLLPVPEAPYAPGYFDKVAHVGLFVGLGFLSAWSAAGSRRHRALTALGMVTALGAVTELLQGVLPYRSGDPLDLAADLAGGLVGGLVGSLLRPR